MINPNWSRWIFASLSVHFDDVKDEVPFFVEGQIRPTTVSDFAEFRMDGPLFNEINADNWYIHVLLAILIQVTQDNSDIHRLERNIGTFISGFTKAICVYKYGDQPQDDGTQFGVLQLTADSIRVDKFGQVQSATRISQATIEANYLMILKT